MPQSASRSIPSLDGLRACSVVMVILSHFLGYLPDKMARFPYLQLRVLGESGVDVFFVISGFLITGLLLRELEARGSISLRRFYFRRFFRIFPPFYFFLAVVAILWATKVVSIPVPGFISAATYTSDYWGHPAWILAHTWSLSLEEQFYLLWPPFVALLGRRRSTYLAIGVVVLSPAIRLLNYVLAPPLRGSTGYMLHTRLDMIMFGCAIALLWHEKRFHNWADRFLHPAIFAFATLYVVFLAPFLSVRFQAWYDWPIGYTLLGLLISLILIYAVKKPLSIPGRFFNLAPMKHVGIISYSIYLWQQIFMGSFGGMFPVDLIPTFAAAELSYRLIERPSYWLRDRLQRKLWPQPTLSNERFAHLSPSLATEIDAATIAAKE
jgi:peptidoglycan/LPS O-acetylase OafA/YrhL